MPSRPLQLLKTARLRFAILGELLGFLKERRSWWLLSLVVAAVAVGIVVLAISQPAVTPFIYVMF